MFLIVIYSPTPRLPSIDVDVSGSVGEIDTISMKPQACDKDENPIKDMAHKCQPSSNTSSLVKLQLPPLLQ